MPFVGIKRRRTVGKGLGLRSWVVSPCELLFCYSSRKPFLRATSSSPENRRAKDGDSYSTVEVEALSLT